MTDDEFRPNPPAPVFRRSLRLDVERNGSSIALTVEDPQSPAEVTGFFDLVATVLNPQAADSGYPQPFPQCDSGAPGLAPSSPTTRCAGPVGHLGDHAERWPPDLNTMRWTPNFGKERRS